jgi:hypothetical protein
MKTLKEMFNWLLLEGKIDNLKLQYPDVADKIELFANTNPKYLSWVAKQLKPETSPEELEQLRAGFY